MYKTFTADEYRNHFNLPSDYRVDGFLCFGGWMEEKQRNEIISILNNKNINYEVRVLDGFLSHALEIKIDGKIIWFVVMYGGTMLSEYLHLACLFGSKKNIHVGSCGGLSKNIDSLDIIVPTFSYGNESITRIYDKESTDFKHYPDINLSNKLMSDVGDKYNVKTGSIITNQAMLGESLEDIMTWSSDGYTGVEMETSTVFSISKSFGVPSTAVLYVSDNLVKGQTVGDESHMNQKEKREEIRNYLLSVALKNLME